MRKGIIIKTSINFSIFVLTVILFSIIAEVIMQINSKEKNLVDTLSECVRESSDENMGLEFIPNSECTFKGTQVKINSQGLRDYEYKLEKQENVFRIVTLGDSYTFGWGVELNESYPKLIESSLNENSDKKYEIINFGTPSHNTMQEARLLEIKAIAYKPDLIIIGYTMGDPECYWKFCSDELKAATYNAFEKSFSIPTDHITKERLLQRSLFLRFISNKYDIILHRLNIRRMDDNNVIIKLHYKNSATWKSVQESFRKISKIAKENNAEVLIVVFPEIDFLSSDYILSDVSKQVIEEADKNGFNTLDLFPYFVEEEPRSLMVTPGDDGHDGHPNAKAHKIAADAVYNFMKKEEII